MCGGTGYPVAKERAAVTGSIIGYLVILEEKLLWELTIDDFRYYFQLSL
jgi:hypothetical protein